MTEKLESIIKLPPVEQIGIVVKDIDKAIAFYSSVFGLGPFKVVEIENKGFTYKGKKGDCKMKLAFTRSGPMEIELVQILEGETPHTDFLKEIGEGVQHLRFRVKDLDSELAKLSKEGIEPVFYNRMAEFGVAFAYINSDKIGGVMFELFETPEGFQMGE